MKKVSIVIYYYIFLLFDFTNVALLKSPELLFYSIKIVIIFGIFR